MKKIAVLTALAVALVFGLGVAFAAPPDKMVIKEIQKVKGPVHFDHKAHTGVAKNCQACHHADAAGKEQKCSKCHTDKTDGKKLSLKDAFHKQCKDCHTKRPRVPPSATTATRRRSSAVGRGGRRPRGSTGAGERPSRPVSFPFREFRSGRTDRHGKRAKEEHAGKSKSSLSRTGWSKGRGSVSRISTRGTRPG